MNVETLKPEASFGAPWYRLSIGNNVLSKAEFYTGIQQSTGLPI